MQPHARTDRRSQVRTLLLKGAAVFLGLVSLVVPIVTFAVGESFPIVPADGFAVVERGPMEVIVTQVGDVESAENLFLVNQCEFSTRIISIVPDGTLVRAGDVVAELDSSSLRQLALQREVYVVNAEAALKQAEEELRIQQLTNSSRLASADLASRLGRLKLDGYKEAEGPQRLHELQAAVALAEEAAARGEEILDFTRRMVSLGYRNRTDEERQRLSQLKSRHDLDAARAQLQLFEEFTYERKLIRLNALTDEAEANLERTHRVNRAATLNREIRLQTYRRLYLVYKNYLDRINRSIAACTIRAPRDGEVIRGTVSSSSSAKVEDGSSVRFLQSIAKIPDRDRMQIQLRVHESKIHLLETGQPAVISVDAAQGKTFLGKVAKVSIGPVSPRYPNYDLREYGVVVDVAQDAALAGVLAPGMTATANIIAAERQDVVTAPIQSVVEVAGRHVAFVRCGDNVEPREVTLGLTGADSVEILQGLDEGEQVVMKPRITCAKRIVALEGRFLAGIPSRASANL